MHLGLFIADLTASEHDCFRARHCEQGSLSVVAGVHLRFPDRHCLHAFAVLIRNIYRRVKETMKSLEVLSHVDSGEDGRRERGVKIKSLRRRRRLMGGGDWLLHDWYTLSQYQH